jgi:hypothetical protein
MNPTTVPTMNEVKRMILISKKTDLKLVEGYRKESLLK